MTLLLVLGGLSAPIEAADTLRLCWEDSEKPPYLLINKSESPQGIAVDLTAAVLHQAGLTVHAVVHPWKRCLAELAAGNIDLVPNASFARERTQFALYSQALYVTHMAFFYNPRRFPKPPSITTLEDLRPYRIGGVLGFNYAHLEGIPLDTGAKTRVTLLRKLEAGRIDLASEQLEVMLEVIRRHAFGHEQFAYVADPIAPEKTFHILISKKNPQAEALRERLDAAIATLSRDGTLARINARALPPPRP